MHRTAVLLAVLTACRRSTGVAGAIIIVTDAMMLLKARRRMPILCLRSNLWHAQPEHHVGS
jgi:hypothetical protein